MSDSLTSPPPPPSSSASGATTMKLKERRSGKVASAGFSLRRTSVPLRDRLAVRTPVVAV